MNSAFQLIYLTHIPPGHLFTGKALPDSTVEVGVWGLGVTDLGLDSICFKMSRRAGLELLNTY